jgi:hypothetical protein
LKNTFYIINLTVKINYKCLYALKKLKLKLQVQGKENIVKVYKWEDNDWRSVPSSPIRLDCGVPMVKTLQPGLISQAIVIEI